MIKLASIWFSSFNNFGHPKSPKPNYVRRSDIMINEDKGLRTYRTYTRTVLSAVPVRTNYSRSDK